MHYICKGRSSVELQCQRLQPEALGKPMYTDATTAAHAKRENHHANVVYIVEIS